MYRWLETYFLCSPDLDSTCSIEMVNDCREVWWGKLKTKRKNNHTRRTQPAPARKKRGVQTFRRDAQTSGVRLWLWLMVSWSTTACWVRLCRCSPLSSIPSQPSPACVCANGSWLRLNRECTNTTAVEPLSSPAYCRSNGPPSCAAGPIWAPLCFHKPWPAGDGCTEERRRRDEGSDLNFKGWWQTDLPVCTLQGRGAVVLCGKS